MFQHDTAGDLNIIADNPANAANISFYTNSATKRLTIDSSGRVLIGLNTNHANASIDDLQVGNPTSSTQRGITLVSSDECPIACS